MFSYHHLALKGFYRLFPFTLCISCNSSVNNVASLGIFTSLYLCFSYSACLEYLFLLLTLYVSFSSQLQCQLLRTLILSSFPVTIIAFSRCSGVVTASIYFTLTKRWLYLYHFFLVNRHTVGKWQNSVAVFLTPALILLLSDSSTLCAF